jgi:cytochrome oxidase Cu insertion factor (SCO1/SenC/PrrC family)
VAVALCLLLPSFTYAHDGKTHEGAPEAKVAPDLMAASRQTKDQAYFSDLPVVNQEGDELHFFTDLLRDQVVLVNFLYTNCKDTCPVMTSKLVHVKKLLGDQMDSAVHFISISTDPERDTPAALKAFADANRVKSENWTFLTGEKKNIDHIIGRFGQYNEQVEAHSTLMLVGNLKTRHWSKIPPMASPQMIATKLETLIEET